MRLAICAVGRLRRGPEKDMLDDYAARIGRAGRALSLGPLSVAEVEAPGGP
ncbi:MAG: 23S rRNA (pseudouridine(1915)-N(3))-methyltransferase RlmH, partial [Hasllibacter sp.]